MKIFVNDKEVTTEASSLEELLSGLTGLPDYYSVAVNDVIVPRGTYASYILKENDYVTVFAFMQGG
ncbi:sulfur carrier protein ThiS [Ruminobacter sp.]|jgi:sulfur carrier protein|uniref:sulfur carrier protein ThiS n=1 Tax=Ruminobacter sp. TaxID=2774296 RepID=UPI0038695C60